MKDTEELIKEAKDLLEHVTANLVDTCKMHGMSPREVERAVLEHPDRLVMIKIIVRLEMMNPRPMLVVCDGSLPLDQIQKALFDGKLVAEFDDVARRRHELPVFAIEDFSQDILPDPVEDFKGPPRQTWKRNRKKYF